MRIRSPRTVQQMHPLFISNISSSAPITRSWSTPTSPNSFSMTAIRLPCFAERMSLRRVVLPAPRKPVRTVTGTRSVGVVIRGLSYQRPQAPGRVRPRARSRQRLLIRLVRGLAPVADQEPRLLLRAVQTFPGDRVDLGPAPGAVGLVQDRLPDVLQVRVPAA